jgi:arginine N-succinyltransferase
MHNLETPLVVRRAHPGDLSGLCRLAQAGGPGLTNLPPDRAHLAERLRTSAASRDAGLPPIVLFVLEAAGRVAGSAAIWPRIGLERPFYSYRLAEEAAAWEPYALMVRTRTLTLTTMFTGCAEVGGLIVDPEVRGRAAGRLLARARYLFMAEHRAELPGRVVAELRGWQDEDGVSPVWEALGRRFFDLPFPKADRLSLAGHDFIAAMAPRHPVYVDVLSREAQAAIGRPHQDSRGALKLLIEEGFEDSGHVDVFDGGPTVVASVDRLTAVRESRVSPLVGVEVVEGETHLVSAGVGQAFRAARGGLRPAGTGVVLDRALAATIGVGEGDLVRHVAF